MKKKTNKSEDSFDNNEIFPVDSLGIPILVDVVDSVKSGIFPNGEEGEIEIPLGHSEPASRPDPGQKVLTESSAEVHLDQITGKIAESVTREILLELEPFVREKVSLALHMYEDELLKISDEENGKKPETD